MRYVVSISGGLASAVTAERVIRRHGREAVTLWFADTSAEDDDLHRFLRDLERRWGGEIVRHKDGRNPYEVHEELGFIPNSRNYRCSQVLKIDPFLRFLAEQPKPVTVCIGFDWSEADRWDKPREIYGAVEGVTVEYPLLWPPLEAAPYAETVQGWGIDIPLMYREGFQHNNCGKLVCCRAGQETFARAAALRPAAFRAVRDWETRMRERPGLGEFAILRDRRGGATRPLPLAEFERRGLAAQAPLVVERQGCFCDFV